MAIKTPKDSVILLPADVLQGIKNATADELKILIYFFANPETEIAVAARDLEITLANAEKAVAFWRGAGVFADAEPKPKKTTADTSAYRNYTSEDINNALAEKNEFVMIKGIAEQSLQKVNLTKNDLSALLYLYDFAGIPAPVICGVITDCCANEKANMQYIYKKTLALYEDGIDSYDKLEAYFARRKEINSQIGKLRKLIGAGDRALTSKEKKLFDCWFGDWGFDFDIVKHAYEITVDNTGKFSTTYMNSILRRWNESGFQTVEDVNNGEASRQSGVEHSFEGDEFITAALKRGFED